MHIKNIGLVLYVISALVVAKEELKPAITKSLIFTEIQAQCYMKGQVEGEKDWLVSKTSQDYYSEKFSGETYYEACVDNFKIAKHEVTLSLYTQYANETDNTQVGEVGCYVVGKNGWENNLTADWRNPTFHQDKNHPVVCVSYYEAQKFIDWLNKKLKPTFLYRLPTETEWELAARGSIRQRNSWRYWGNDIAEIEACKYGNVSDLTLNDFKKQDATFNCRDGTIHTSNVHSYEANDYELFNMLGNAQEFTCSGFSQNSVELEGVCENESTAENITVKGASWYYPPMFNRAAFRGGLPRHLRFYGVGFRLAQDTE